VIASASPWAVNPDPKPIAARFEAWLFRFTAGERLAFHLAVLAALLAAPSLFIGFHLDDYIGRFVNSELPGAERLYRLYAGGYGLANGVRADTRWQMDQGYAPWWSDPDLHIELARPLSLLTHTLDARLWPHSAVAQHAHSIAWLVLVVVCATRLYRGVLGSAVGGLAALLFAVDHTHGFIVGFISNRHALVTAVFGLFCLDQHHRATDTGRGAHRLAALGLYLVSLLAGEFALAIAGYLVAHALFLERGSIARRLLSLAPYVLLTLVWRVVYTKLGYGTHGSGLYVDPIADPLEFIVTFAKRAPVLGLGQFLLPPAEAYVFYGPKLVWVVRAFGLIFLALLAFALIPLLRHSKSARFWAAGYVLSLVPATAAYPSGRLLLFSSIGAIGLVAELWHLFAVELRGRVRTSRLRFSEAVGALVLFVHIGIAPFAAPFATCGIVVSAPLSRAADALGPEIEGRDVLLLSAPDFFGPRVAVLRKTLERGPLPRRWRALSSGPERVTIERSAPAALVLGWEDGLLSEEYTRLFRSLRAPMREGDRVELEGLVVTILDVTPDGRPRRAEFRFDEQLDSGRFIAYAWRDGTFARLLLPEVGGRVELPKAEIDVPVF
jgi:hypothetical protein